MPLVTFLFKGGSHLSVEQSLLQRNPKLALLIPLSPCTHCTTSSQSLSLKSISRSAGHTFIHYLHTNTYQVLEWLGPTTGREETIAKLKISLEVYATARKYELDGLETLAREQISLLSKDLEAFTVIDAINEIYPSSSNKDTWFPAYMKAIVKTAFEGSTAPAKSEIRDPSESEQEGSVSTAETLLRGALEVYREMVEALAVNYAPIMPEKPTPAINSPQIKNDGRGGSETAGETEKDKTNILAALEEIRINDPVRQAKPDPNSVDTVKDIKNGKVEKGCAAREEPQVGEQQPAEPKPTPKLQEEANATTGSTTGRSASGGLFSGTGTAGAIFGARDNATTSGLPPGATTSLPFTPFTAKYNSYSSDIDCFQNILCTEAYRGWSSEELRLDDYNHGRKQGNAGLGSSAQTNTGFGTIKTSPWFTNAGGFSSSGFGCFGPNTATTYVGSLFGAKPATSTSTSPFEGFGGGLFGVKPTTSTSTSPFGGSGGGLFGAKPATSTSTSPFGGFGGGLFGVTNTETTGFGSGSGFGFGSSGGFGSNTAGFGSSGGFGSSTAGFGSGVGFGSSTPATNTETTGFGSGSSFGFGSSGSIFDRSRGANS